MQDGGSVGTRIAHDLVDIVQAHTGEPPRPRHLGAFQHAVGGITEVEVLPQRTPERGGVVDRPLPQRPVIRYRCTGALLHEPGEIGDACVGDIAFRRLPLRSNQRL